MAGKAATRVDDYRIRNQAVSIRLLAKIRVEIAEVSPGQNWRSQIVPDANGAHRAVHHRRWQSFHMRGSSVFLRALLYSTPALVGQGTSRIEGRSIPLERRTSDYARTSTRPRTRWHRTFPKKRGAIATGDLVRHSGQAIVHRMCTLFNTLLSTSWAGHCG